MGARPMTWDVSLLRRDHEHRRTAGRLVFCLIGVLMGMPALSHAQTGPSPSSPQAPVRQQPTEALGQIRAYAKAGALELALSSIQAGQPAYAQHPRAWLAWESLKFKLLTQAQRWQALTKAVSQLPAGLTDAVRTGFETAGVRAWLALHHRESARVLLQKMLWSTAQAPPPDSVRLWRRLLIEAYLEANRTDDARLALLQYQADYTIRGAAEREILARVWLRVHEPRYALELLKPHAHRSGAWLYWLAELKAGSRPAVDIERDAEHAARAKGLDAAEAARLWGVAAAAALERHAWGGAVRALERYLALVPRIPMNVLLPYDGDTLWATYQRYGDDLGNRNQLLLGDDTAWEAAARRAGKSGKAITARTYNATLALTGQTPAGRMTGYRWLLTALLAQPQGPRLVDRLFLTAPKTFPHLSALPVPVRLVLANDAVDRHDLALAARLMVGVNEVPPGENAFDWSLRVARVLILGGKPEQGATTLQVLLKHSQTLKSTQADRLMQVLFNLQSLKRNQLAINLFQALQPHLKDVQLRRQVLFWEGDSYKAMGRYRAAARVYLQSALQGGKQAYDQWGQTARYNASQVLEKAGMTGDARRILSELLARTKAPERVSFLKQKLAALGQGGGDS